MATASSAHCITLLADIGLTAYVSIGDMAEVVGVTGRMVKWRGSWLSAQTFVPVKTAGAFIGGYIATLMKTERKSIIWRGGIRMLNARSSWIQPINERAV